MHLGRVKCYFQGRGYGYIEDSEGREVYFHTSALEESKVNDDISVGLNVYFDMISTGLGFEALRVRFL